MAVPPVFSGLRHPERSQRERTRREDRHFKFYEIPDNLLEARLRDFTHFLRSSRKPKTL
jgi:hypothetical protein